MNETAAKGFGSASDAYDRGRPDYPKDAVSYLASSVGVRPGATVVDVGAGTGKLTRLLAPFGAELYAIEPVAAMRERCATSVPAARVLEGTAEQLPLADRSADAILVAQAFHWFDGEKTLAEFHRVLKPRGKVGLIWNVRDEDSDLMRGLTGIMERYERNTPRYRTGAWRTCFDGTSLFTPLEHRAFSHVQRGPAQLAVDRVLSVSFMAVLPKSEQEKIADEIRGFTGAGEVELRYRTDTFVCASIP